jgi:HAD superfamily hydrolase (TIGR01548 family)
LKKANPQHEAPQKLAENFAILFDLDGVLVDVSGSYRRAIQETVGFFTGKKAQLKEIQGLKEQGGYNNDWDLTERLIIGRDIFVPKAEIIKKFQEFYIGVEGKRGLIENEKWLLSREKLNELHKKHFLGIVTGRPREETLYILRKFVAENLFDIVVAMEDYPKEKAKPDPYPINLALQKLSKREAIYVGDSVDDIEAAKRAGIKPIGCIPPGVSATRLKELLLKHGAKKVLDSINEINESLD